MPTRITILPKIASCTENISCRVRRRLSWPAAVGDGEDMLSSKIFFLKPNESGRRECRRDDDGKHGDLPGSYKRILGRAWRV